MGVLERTAVLRLVGAVRTEDEVVIDRALEELNVGSTERQVSQSLDHNRGELELRASSWRVEGIDDETVQESLVRDLRIVGTIRFGLL